MDTRPIGIFDSGVGGMTVLAEIRKQLPKEDLIYLGDTKNFPYGDKSQETIIKIATKCVNFLIKKNVKLVIIACGTATSYYKMVSYGKVPEVLLWSVDPWVFFGSEAAFDERADAELYNEFLTKVLGVQTDYEEPDKVELWKALADPAYFQGNVDYFVKNRGQTTVTDDEGNTIEFNPVTGNPYRQTATIKRTDGSVLYDTAFRGQTQDQILSLAAAACETFNSVHMEGFDTLDKTQCEAFDAFIRYAQSQGTTVVLILSPWHPYLYDYLLSEPENHSGFFAVEAYVRKYCAQNNIPLYGSYDPTKMTGLVEMDFFDGLHCKDSGIKKFFPGVTQILSDVQNNTLPDPLAVTARTRLPTEEELAAAAAAQTAETATPEQK